MKQFNLVVCGGTFDHFHKGHKSFLRYVFSVGRKIIVGLTSDEYVQNSKFIPIQSGQNSKFIEPFEKRKQAVIGFVKREGALSKVEIQKIDDLFGPTLSKNIPLDALVVSESTKKGGELINKKRKELGFQELKIFIAPQVLAEDGKLVSSKRVRNGEINREGKPYVNSLWFKKDLILPQNLRKEFKKPFGELFKEFKSPLIDKNSLIITVGDVTTKMFNEKRLGQQISVIDFKVARKKNFSSILELGFNGQETVFKIDNAPGYITSGLFRELAKIFKKELKGKVIVQINGEEDLAVLPLVLFSPLNTIIYYGQPNKGIVKVKISEENKNKAYKLASRITRGY